MNRRILVLLCWWVVAGNAAAVTVSGELKKWHKLTLRCEGPVTSETDATNPFTSRRLNARFHHPASGRTYLVPGYYAADGAAAETGAGQGNVWHVHFSPDETGTWEYRLSFRLGSGVAVDASPLAGSPAGYFDGAAGTFEVAPSDKTGRDLRGKGRLQYVGKHHLRFAETGEFFMKCGTDSPENLLAYDDIDGTPNAGSRRKSWAPHAGDFPAGEAAPFGWQDPGVEGIPPKGSELLGAVRYLSDQGLNAMSFLTFSLDGDDDNVFPHLIQAGVSFGTSGDNGRWDGNVVHHDRFDVSKLDQWERIFAYATTKGIYLHFKTQETENDQKMDGGELGPERKLYYRELVARFGHHLALNWNLGEENTNSDAQRVAFTQWFHDNDPYRHPVVMHSYDSNQGDYTPLLGAASKLTGVSLQPNDDAEFDTVFPESKRWVEESAEEGKPWVVACDEPGNSTDGLRSGSNPANHAHARKNALWGIAMAGGAGIEWYFGNNNQNPDAGDLSCQDFRSRESFWPVCRHLLDFWNLAGVPFWEMTNADALVSGGNRHCLARAGDCYVVQLESGGSATLDLTAASGPFEVRWYDPRNGGALQAGSVTGVTGGGSVSLGDPPAATGDDWIALVRRAPGNSPPAFPGAVFATGYQTPAVIGTAKLLFTVTDAEGHAVTLDFSGSSSARGGALAAGPGMITYTPPAGFSGQDVFFLTATDALGASTGAMVTAIVGPPAQLGVAGANPAQIEALGGDVMVRFRAIPGVGYRVQRSADLLVWETLATVTADPAGVVTHIDEDPPPGSGFYRILPP